MIYNYCINQSLFSIDNNVRLQQEVKDMATNPPPNCR